MMDVDGAVTGDRSRTIRRSCYAAVVVVMGCLSGCSAGSAPVTGVLTGNARACASLASVPMANLGVYRGSVLVARGRVPDDTTYRFVLPPGTYDITNTGNRDGGSGRSVTVVAGKTSQMDVPNLCF
jgi:hypothetical protein